MRQAASVIARTLIVTFAGMALLAACSPDTPENEVAAGNALEAAEGGSAEQESATAALNGEIKSPTTYSGAS